MMFVHLFSITYPPGYVYIPGLIYLPLKEYISGSYLKWLNRSERIGRPFNEVNLGAKQCSIRRVRVCMS